MASMAVVLRYVLCGFFFKCCVVDEATAIGNACSEERKRNKNDIRKRTCFSLDAIENDDL